jgi:hypothetical protein
MHPGGLSKEHKRVFVKQALVSHKLHPAAAQELIILKDFPLKSPVSCTVRRSRSTCSSRQ